MQRNRQIRRELPSVATTWKRPMQANDGMSKVPAVTLGCWVIKIIATTLGETGGDAVSMTLYWGYALSSTMFIVIFAAAVAAQIAARRVHPLSHWPVIMTTTAH